MSCDIHPVRHACPFCGDDREPVLVVDSLDDGIPPINSMCCQCCGAHGPLTVSPAAALETFRRRWPAGRSAEWRAFYEAEVNQGI